MNLAEYHALKATFPWTEQIIQTPNGGFIRVHDRNGNEVSILSMVALLSMVTRKLVQESGEENEE